MSQFKFIFYNKYNCNTQIIIVMIKLITVLYLLLLVFSIDCYLYNSYDFLLLVSYYLFIYLVAHFNFQAS